MKIRKLAYLSLSLSLALILSYLESLVPMFVAIPGIKMGLTNLAIVFVLYRFGWLDALTVSALRVLLVGVLFGSFVSFLYSLSGAVFSFLVMLLLKKTNRFSTVGISVSGGVTHNLAQIAVAAFLLGKGVFAYLPVLLIGGAVSGIFIGILSALLIKKVKLPDSVLS